MLAARSGEALELDELCVRRKGSLWLWLARCRKSGQILSAALGDRSGRSLAALWEGLPKAYRRKLVYTDGYPVYWHFFADWQHTVCDKGDGRTSRIEGINTLFRSRVSGLVRKSCGVCAWVAGRVTDVWERFLLVCDWHNQRCRRRWEAEKVQEASTPKRP